VFAAFTLFLKTTMHYFGDVKTAGEEDIDE